MSAVVQLQRGGNTTVSSPSSPVSTVVVGIGWSPLGVAGLEVDGSAFLLGKDGKVRGDHDFVFYNNPRSSDGAVEVLSGESADVQQFQIDLNRVPAEIDRIAFCVTIHEGQALGQSFGSLQRAWAKVYGGGGVALAEFDLPLSGSSEVAMIFAELYRRNQEWKFRAVGQGFQGGLGPLATSFGIHVAADPVAPAPSASPPPSSAAPSATPSPAAPAADARAVRLDKKLIDLEKKDPQLVNLAKKAAVSLAKKGLADHQAKVALCLDISASMSGLYKSGSVAQLVQKILALALRFDDDGDIDVFLFGAGAHEYGAVDANSYRDFVPTMQRRYPLEGGTNYGLVIDLIRNHYKGEKSFGSLPVYVMFVTDGDTQNKNYAERQIREASSEGIFWQFMAVGAKGKGFFGRLASSDFSFLEKLDALAGRKVDNAGFFLVGKPTELPDDQLYDLLMNEYPQWLKAARDAGVLRAN